MKRLFSALRPDEICSSVHEIDYERLRGAGYRALIFDIDNTLGEWGCPQISEAVYALLQRVEAAGFAVGFLSNDSGEDRLLLKAQLGAWPVVWRAGKPKTHGYERLIALLRSSPSQTVMIGDQLFTDIWGAKRTGLYAILVAPVSLPSDSFWAKLRRPLERLLLWLFSRENPPHDHADNR